jgi:hypothetical protein
LVASGDRVLAMRFCLLTKVVGCLLVNAEDVLHVDGRTKPLQLRFG